MLIPRLITDLKLLDERLQTFAATSPALLAKSYAPGKWSGHVLISHIADAHLAFTWRFLLTIAEEGKPIIPFDQDLWVKELEEEKRPVEASIAMVHAATLLLVHSLETLAPAKLQRRGLHPEKGELTALRMATIVARHGLHHLEQLETIRASG